MRGSPGVYSKVIGMAAPMRSNACRWGCVGMVIFSIWQPPMVMVWRVRVAGWSSRSRKLPGRLAGGGDFPGGFGVSGGGAAGGGDGVVPLGWVFVGVGQRCPGFAQVPGQVTGEHADQHVGFDAVFGPGNRVARSGRHGGHASDLIAALGAKTAPSPAVLLRRGVYPPGRGTGGGAGTDHAPGQRDARLADVHARARYQLADLALRSTAECTGQPGARRLPTARATSPGNLVKLLIAEPQPGCDVPG